MKKLLAAILLLLSSAAFAQSEPPTNVSPNELNGWRASGLGGPAQFYKDANGTVHLQGLIHKWGPMFQTTRYDEPVFTLPPGYRPTHDSWFPVLGTAGLARLLVYANGTVQIDVTFEYFTWVSLSGVTFRAS